MSKNQKSEQDKIKAWVEFYNNLYHQPPEKDYSLKEWHEWYKDNRQEIDDYVVEVGNSAAVPEYILLPDKINIPQAPNAVEPKKKKSAFEIAVNESDDELKKLTTEEMLLVKKIGDEYRSTKYKPLFDALQEYESRLQHHVKIRESQISKINEAMKQANQSISHVVDLNNSIFNIETKQSEFTSIKNHLDINSANRKKAMEDINKSLSIAGNPDLGNKLSIFLTNLNNENRSLNVGLATDMNIVGLEEMGASKLQEIAQYLVQQFDAPKPKAKGFFDKVQGVFKPNLLSNYEILENARQAQKTLIDNNSIGLDADLQKLNESRVKAANVMKRDMDSVVKAQTKYTYLLQDHYDEAKRITVEASQRYKDMESNKGQKAVAELAEFEMSRTYNMLEAVRIDVREINEAVKNSKDYAKTSGILNVFHKIYDHFMTQLTGNDKLKTPIDSPVQSSKIQSVEVASSNVSEKFLPESSKSQAEIPSPEALLKQSNFTPLEQLATPSLSLEAALEVSKPASSRNERSTDYNQPDQRNIPPAPPVPKIPPAPPVPKMSSAQPSSNIPPAPPVPNIPPAPPIPRMSSASPKAEVNVANDTRVLFELGPKEGGFESAQSSQTSKHEQDIQNPKQLKPKAQQTFVAKPENAMSSLRTALAERRKVIKEEKHDSDSENEEISQLNTKKSSEVQELNNKNSVEVSAPTATPSNFKFKAPVRSRNK